MKKLLFFFITLTKKNQMKKSTFLILFMISSFITYSQDMKISLSDNDGREFSIRSVTASFSYSMIAGDEIEYEPSYSDNAGKIKKVGSVTIMYEPSYSDNAGKIKKVGGMTIMYEPSYSDNAGKIKSTRGSIN